MQVNIPVPCSIWDKSSNVRSGLLVVQKNLVLCNNSCPIQRTFPNIHFPPPKPVTFQTPGPLCHWFCKKLFLFDRIFHASIEVCYLRICPCLDEFGLFVKPWVGNFFCKHRPPARRQLQGPSQGSWERWVFLAAFHWWDMLPFLP